MEGSAWARSKLFRCRIMAEAAQITRKRGHPRARRRGDSLRRSQSSLRAPSISEVLNVILAMQRTRCHTGSEPPSAVETRQVPEVHSAATHSNKKPSRCSTILSKARLKERSSKISARSPKACIHSFNNSWAWKVITRKDTLGRGRRTRTSHLAHLGRISQASAATACRRSSTTARPRRWAPPASSATATATTK